MKHLVFLIFLANCSHVNTEKLYIYQTPDKSLVVKALNIVIDKLDEKKIFTKEQMLDVLNNGNFKAHDCKDKDYTLKIIFTMGEWGEKEKRHCIYSNNKRFKGICLMGRFDGLHTIIIQGDQGIHKTSFAHELLHYFRLHIMGEPFKNHIHKEFWERLVGFNISKIGILNEELKGGIYGSRSNSKNKK